MNQGTDFQLNESEETVLCDLCGNVLEACMCVCPYCGRGDKCECCLHDSMTGGWTNFSTYMGWNYNKNKGGYWYY